jgi:thiol-disulfide isomerase/thioredoxin
MKPVMKKYIKILSLTIMCLMISMISVAQKLKPRELNVGQKMPDYLFTRTVDFPSGKRSTADFKGKWLILDFWATTCGACVNSFPKMNKLQKDFKEDVQLIMVGANGRYEKTRVEPFYATYKKNYKLDFAVAFDSLLFAKFDIYAVPHIAVIDPEGVIKAVLLEIDSTQIAQFISGKTPENLRHYTLWRKSGKDYYDGYDRKQMFLTGGNGGIDTNFSYRSLITYMGKSSSVPLYVNTGFKQGKLEMVNFPPEDMFKYAFFKELGWGLPGYRLYGNTYDGVILKIKDSLLLSKANPESRYSYSLKMPIKGNMDSLLMNKMKNDLMEYFNVKAGLEKITVPVLKLKVVDSNRTANLVSKDQSAKRLYTELGHSVAGFELRNAPIAGVGGLINQIASGLRQYGHQAILDETGIDKKIDIKIDAFMKDMTQVQKALKKNGLELVPDTASMDVLVIRD